MPQFVDTHQHLWDLSLFKLPWTEGGGALARDHLMSDYVQAAAQVEIARTVYMEVDVDPSQRVDEADYVSALCAADDNPMAGAVISGEPSDQDFSEYVARFADNPHIKGIRRVLHPPEILPGYCLQPDFVRGVQTLGTCDLSFDLCLRPSELGDGIKLVDQCPGTRFVVDHCGNADPYVVGQQSDIAAGDGRDDPYNHDRQQWMDAIAELGEHPNVICKISGIIARVRPGWTAQDLAPTVDHCLESFDSDRVVFGGDWPVCTLAGATLADWTEALLEIIAGRLEEDQQKLLVDNADRFYGLL